MAVYEMTRDLPDNERFGLVSQLRRTAVSVPSNIAEGNTSGSDGIYLRHVRIARGSVGELETQLRIVDNLDLLEHGVPKALWDDVGHMARLTNGLWRYLRDKTSRQ
ncbi:MAG: four helix bundle protein [Persicimonas sp.]